MNLSEFLEHLNSGKPVNDTLGIFPPFYTDCGKNIMIGNHVFFNSGCKFQDQGGITIVGGILAKKIKDIPRHEEQ